MKCAKITPMLGSAINGRRLMQAERFHRVSAVSTAIRCRFEQNEYQTLCRSSDRDGEATVNLRRTSREVLDLCIFVRL